MITSLGRRTEIQHCTRNFLEHVGEVLGTHPWSRKRLPRRLAEHTLRGHLRETHRAFVANRHRIPRNNRHRR